MTGDPWKVLAEQAIVNLSSVDTYLRRASEMLQQGADEAPDRPVERLLNESGVELALVRTEIKSVQEKLIGRLQQ
ncbi:hypothetical protein M0R72_16670 [Candidatus Pacearchaeota archaeon]|jgi:hypothetical protein|nr:hypothetical protein [Candidatus Pacearchaeota archaeon]